MYISCLPLSYTCMYVYALIDPNFNPASMVLVQPRNQPVAEFDRECEVYLVGIQPRGVGGGYKRYGLLCRGDLLFASSS